MRTIRLDTSFIHDCFIVWSTRWEKTKSESYTEPKTLKHFHSWDWVKLKTSTQWFSLHTACWWPEALTRFRYRIFHRTNSNKLLFAIPMQYAELFICNRCVFFFLFSKLFQLSLESLQLNEYLEHHQNHQTSIAAHQCNHKAMPKVRRWQFVWLTRLTWRRIIIPRCR